MAYWHEVYVRKLGWVFPPKPESRVGAVFSGESVRIAPFEGHFLKYEGKAEPIRGFFPSWKRSPEGWFELWPKSPIKASSMEEAKLLIEPLRQGLEDGSLDSEFEKRPYQPPIVPELIKDIEHATHVATAKIVQFPDGLYSVEYLVYAPNGRYMPASTPSISAELEWEWGVTKMRDDQNRELRTLADDLESAEQIALEELNILVAKDSEIKPR